MSQVQTLYPAPFYQSVAQWAEQRSPKPQVESSRLSWLAIISSLNYAGIIAMYKYVMRLYEIVQPVNEAINFVQFAGPAEQAIKQGILDAVDTLVNVRITPEIQQEINQTKKFGSVKNLAKLVEQMSQNCSNNLTTLAVEVMKVPETSVSFKDIGTNRGECSEKQVRLSTRYLTRIGNQIWSTWALALASNNVSNPPDYNNTAKRIIRKFKTQIFSRAVMIEIDDCVSVFIHEMVHAQQDMQQYNKGISSSDSEYRSYLTSKDKFMQMVTDPASSEFQGADFSRIYQASPQEMAAYAHQYAISFIKDNKLDKANTVADKDVMAKLQNYLGDFYKDRTNRKEYRILKRYGSLVYSNVMDFLARKSEIAKQKTQKQIKPL